MAAERKTMAAERETMAAERATQTSSWEFFQSGALTMVENAEVAATTAVAAFFSNMKALLRQGAQGRNN